MGQAGWWGLAGLVAALAPAVGCSARALGHPSLRIVAGEGGSAASDAAGAGGSAGARSVDAGAGGSGGDTLATVCGIAVGPGDPAVSNPPAYGTACDGGPSWAVGYNLVPDGAAPLYQRCVPLGEVATDLRVSADGRRLAVLAAEVVHLIDVASWREIARVAHPMEPIDGLALSPDGTRLATISSYRGQLTLWDATTGQPLKVFAGTVAGGGAELARGLGLAFSSDGGRIATPMGTIVDLATGASSPFGSIRGGLNRALWFLDGDRAIVGITQYHTGDSWVGQMVEEFDLAGGGRVIAVGDQGLISGDHRYAAGITWYNPTLHVGALDGSRDLQLSMPAAQVSDWDGYARPVALSRQGEALVLAHPDRLSVVSRERPGELISRIPLPADMKFIAVSPTDEIIASGPCGTVAWDWPSGQPRWAKPFPVSQIAWSADASLAVAIGPGKLFRAWRTDTGSDLCSGGGRALSAGRSALDGSAVLLVYQDGAVELRGGDLGGARPVNVQLGPAMLATLANGGGAFATRTYEGQGAASQMRYQVFSTADGARLGVIDLEPRSYSLTATLSPDGRRLAYVVTDHVNLADVASGSPIATLAGSNLLGFSLDGRQLAIADGSGIATYASQDGAPVALMRPPDHPLSGVQITADWSLGVGYEAPPATGGAAVWWKWRLPGGVAEPVPGNPGWGLRITTDGSVGTETDLIFHEFTGDYEETKVRDLASGEILETFTDHAIGPSPDGHLLFGEHGAVFCRTGR